MAISGVAVAAIALAARAPATIRSFPSRRADVEGDGRLDSILISARTRPSGSQTFTLEVIPPSGRGSLSARIPKADLTPTIVGARNINQVPGAEILVHEFHLSSGEQIGIYTFDGHGLRRVGAFWYGGDSAQRYGFACAHTHPPKIVQHLFLLEGPTIYGRWQRTDTMYVWIGATLRRAGSRTFLTRGWPPVRLTRPGC
jgi:hypothetical protein